MMDLGGPGENIAPDEGGGSGGEQLSEEARARFTAAAAGAAQARKDEKKAKKRDDGVASMILQFLTDAQRTHLATLIARIVSTDCPSPFLLAILSLVSPECGKAIEEYLQERGIARPMNDDPQVQWILTMEQVLATNPEQILKALIVDEGNIDGTVLQLTTFVLEDFLKQQGKAPAFEDLQRLTIGILQNVFEGYMHLAPLPAAETNDDEE